MRRKGTLLIVGVRSGRDGAILTKARGFWRDRFVASRLVPKQPRGANGRCLSKVSSAIWKVGRQGRGMPEMPNIENAPDEQSDRVVSWLIRLMAAWGGIALALLTFTFFQWQADPPTSSSV